MPVDLFEVLEATKPAEASPPDRAALTVPERLMLKPEEAASVLGVGRTTVYSLLRTGELESVRIGASRRIPADALTEYVDGLRRQRV